MKIKTDGDFQKLVRERFSDAEEHDRENRLHAVEDLKFKAGEQYPQEVRREREIDGRPCLTVNKMPQFVRQVTGDIRQNKPAIKVRPVDDAADVQIAEIYNGLIRNIEMCSQASSVYATAADNQVTCGIGAWRIVAEYSDDDTFDQDLRIEAIPNALSVYIDPMARKQDKSDARYIFVVMRMPREEFKSKYPDATAVDFEVSNLIEDADRVGDWLGPDTIRVAEYWVVKTEPKEIALLSNGAVVNVADFGDDLDAWAAQNGQAVQARRTVQARKVCQYITNGVELLEPVKEWPGKYIPIIPVVGEEVWIGDRVVRHGLIRFAKDSQRSYNYFTSAAVEWSALQPKAPFMVTVDQIAGLEDLWAQAGKRNLPYLPYNRVQDGSMPQRAAPPASANGLVEQARIASDDIKSVTGIYDASLGAKSNETSGRAIEARKAEGDVSAFVYIDNLSAAIAYTGRQVVDLIPHYYDTERVIRVLGDDASAELVKINFAVIGEDGRPKVLNDLSRGKYDVVVDTGPAYTTRRRESATGMVEFMRAVPQAGPIIMPLLAKAQDWPDADKIAEMAKMLLPPEMRGEQPQQAPPLPPDPTQAANAQLASAKAQGQELDNMAKAQMLGLRSLPNPAETPVDPEMGPAPGGFLG
jgi:hypothetical protein